jgi:hypothetical protein
VAHAVLLCERIDGASDFWHTTTGVVMKRSQAIELVHETHPVSSGRAEVQPVPTSSQSPKTRAQLFAAAHEWVLSHHAETFEKLAK